MRKLATLLLLVSGLAGSVALGSCDTQPEDLDPGFQWQESITELPDALLGGCTFAGNTWAVGGLTDKSAVYRWTSRRWIERATNIQGARLWSCWAGPGNQVIAVGDAGTIFHRSAEGWRRASVPEEAADAILYAVWGMPDGTAVAVGGGLADPSETAVILHYDGSEWTRKSAANVATKNLRGVWGSGVDNYFAVGDNGVIAHFNGTDWRPSNSQVSDRLHAVYGNGPSEMYAVGGTGRGLVLRWNGSSWVSFAEPAESLRTVWTSPDNHLYVAGESGYVGRYDRLGELPGPERFVSSTPFPHLRIHALVGVGNGIFGAASTTLTTDEGEWTGSIVSHLRSFAGPIFDGAAPDATLPDAGALDGSSPDASQ